MTSIFAKGVAQAIIDDLQGAGYYKDPNTLLEFLEQKFEQIGERGSAQEVARAILSDLNESAYFGDLEILAAYLEGHGLR